MRKLIAWILLSKLLVIVAILFSGVGLMPDEAQYWTWSKALSYGYYSKPCGIAWQIAFGCFFFGDTEFGVRFGGLLLSTFLSLTIYRLAIKCALDERQAFWCAIAFSFCPLGMLSGFFATTDCAYVLFWTLACGLFVERRHIALGAVIALGALWKWPIYAVWIPMLLFRRFSWRQYALSIAISLLGLLPSLIWNLQTGFPTFLHVTASMNAFSPSSEELHPNPIDFLGAQIALISPILFGLMVVAFVRSDSQRFCWWTSVLFVGAVFALSCFKKVQGNWAVAAYPTAFVILVAFSLKWLRTGIVVSLLLLVLLFVFASHRLNPLRQGLGWSSIERELLAVGYNPEKEFLFSDRYQWTSILSFYGPEQRRAFFLNFNGHRKNQFDFWPSMKERVLGKNGWYVSFVDSQEKAVWAAKNAQTQLAKYFQKVTSLAPIPIEAKTMILIRCVNYNGKLPTESHKF